MDGEDRAHLSIGLLNPTRVHEDYAKKPVLHRSKSAPGTELLRGETSGICESHFPLRTKSLLDKLLPSFKRAALCLILYLAIGTICFYLVMDGIKGRKVNRVLDSIYFCVVTMTFVGYEDLVPSSIVAKILVCIFVISWLVLVGLLLSKGAVYLAKKQEILLCQALEMSQELRPNQIVTKLETNRARKKCLTMMVVLVILVLVAMVFLAIVEKLDAVDAFYFICSTITTLGYGEKGLSTETGRIFAVFWILISTVCLAVLLCCIVELNTANRQKEFVFWILTKKEDKYGFGG